MGGRRAFRSLKHPIPTLAAASTASGGAANSAGARGRAGGQDLHAGAAPLALYTEGRTNVNAALSAEIRELVPGSLVQTRSMGSHAAGFRQAAVHRNHLE